MRVQGSRWKGACYEKVGSVVFVYSNPSPSLEEVKGTGCGFEKRQVLLGLRDKSELP